MNLFTCLFTPAFVAATLLAANPGLAAEPTTQTNAPAAGKPPRLSASGTNVVAATRPLAQTNAPAASKAPASVVASSNIVVTTTPVAQTKAPAISVTQRAPASVPAAAQLAVTNTLTVGDARLLPASGSNIVVPVENVVRVIPAGPNKIVVSAEQEGHTDIMVLDDDSKITEHYTIIVTKKQHVTEKATYEASLEDFRQVVKKMVGDHLVQFDMMVGPRISFDGTNLVAQPHPVLFIHGEAKDEIEANTIRSVASRFFGRGDFGKTTQEATPRAQFNGAQTFTNIVQLTTLNNDPNIVDQLTIRTHHQVRIRVQVAEVNVDAAKRKGIRYSDSINYGISQGTIPLSALSPQTAAAATLIGSVIPSGGSPATTPAFQATLQLLISDNYARLLSEPTLVTKSGHDASFLAGGQLLQTLQNSLGATSVQSIPFGVRMTIKPTVDRADHIDTEIFTEVSDAPVTVTGVGSTITTRNSEAKLRLNNRETLVLGGLLGNNFRNQIRKLPWLGQVPVLGALFRSKDWQNGQTELLFFITPEIIGSDLKADKERNIATPAMRQWHNVDGHKNILPDPNSHAGPDNDVRDFLGFPPDRMQSEELKQAPVVPDTAPMRGASQ
ncbi:MAG: type II and III secretion system protein [Verrucomicrobia bacterium]|nr:type II and III secretion system protein [Verrucomicrobiota bacterium]